jgi:hypothetical protein
MAGPVQIRYRKVFDTPPRQWRRRGPFLVLGRQNGLALDTGLRDTPGAPPIMYSLNGLVHQQWYFRPVRNHWAEYLIESVEHRLVLDAGRSEELSRLPTMRPRTGEPQQRWRLSRTEDGAGFVLRTVLTHHALDFPVGLKPLEHPHMYPCHRELHQQFILADVSGPRLYEAD